MYTLKSKPEDFKVVEKIKLQRDDDGQYAYFLMKKREYTTQRALDKISGYLKKKVRDIGFAGNKDKMAVTSQTISIKDPSARLGPTYFDRFNNDELSLSFIGRGKKPISLGDLDGNRFEIVVRDCSEPHKIESMINYFDEQRFSKHNVAIGRGIVKGDFKSAAALVDYRDTIAHLEKSPTDFIGAIKRMPLKIRMIYVHSYQSWLWNEVVGEYLERTYGAENVRIGQYSQGELVFPTENIESVRVPIVGFGYEGVSGELGKIIAEQMKKEGITPHSFVIRQLPEMSAEGGEREMVVSISDLRIEKKGEKEFLVAFFLGKGCYATMAVREMCG